MSKEIWSLHPKDETISDLDATFMILYSLLTEKLEQEPKKGIILSKGNPNQRKIPWVKAMRLSHTLEDYFTFRKQLIGSQVCENCRYWLSISEASPHMGCCMKRNKKPIHKWYTCKRFEELYHE